MRPNKVVWALLFFALSVGLILFTDFRLSLALLAGAGGMIATNVLRIDEAYEAVSWPTVFLLASLIPLGQAVQNTGTAAWIAQQILALLDGWPIWGLQAGVALLATVFTLVMSNVGATVLLVPLAVSIAVAAGGDPAIFALTVAISTSNSFLIPTHQVNALIMGTGWLQGDGFHEERWHHDGAVPGRVTCDDERSFLAARPAEICRECSPSLSKLCPARIKGEPVDVLGAGEENGNAPGHI